MPHRQVVLLHAVLGALAALGLALPLGACGDMRLHRPKQERGAPPLPQDTTPSKGSAERASDASEDESGEDAPDIEALERAVTKAGLSLEIERAEQAQAARRETVAIEEARRDVEDAERALEAFVTGERPHRLASLQLRLDMEANDALQAKQELDELTAMYKAEEFANMTKELVLHRGRKRLEHAQRSLQLAQTEAKQTREVELPSEARELRRALTQAKETLRVAEEDAKLAVLHRKHALLDAEEGVIDAQKALDKAKADTSKE